MAYKARYPPAKLSRGFLYVGSVLDYPQGQRRILVSRSSLDMNPTLHQERRVSGRVRYEKSRLRRRSIAKALHLRAKGAKYSGRHNNHNSARRAEKHKREVFHQDQEDTGERNMETTTQGATTRTPSGRITVPYMGALQWLTTIFGAKQHGNRVNVPGAFTHLPCGCDRAAREEIAIGDQQVSWHVTRQGVELVHDECGKKIADL